ncbi:MAG: 30S ribosomal protein S2 [Candidatus Diapherotrites archaeon]
MAEKTLVPIEKYLKTGCHIGTKFKSGDMNRYIFKSRKDSLKVLDVETIDERIKFVAEFLSKYDPARIAVVSRKLYGKTPANKFAEFVGAQSITGRFVPGTFTNPQARIFIEPQIIIVAEPDSDNQAVEEASAIRIPVVGLASTNNSLKNVDLIIPINNKGRKSLALVFWLLAREILKARGDIKTDAEFEDKLPEFEYQMKESDEIKLKERGTGREFQRRGKFQKNKGGKYSGKR